MHEAHGNTVQQSVVSYEGALLRKQARSPLTQTTTRVWSEEPCDLENKQEPAQAPVLALE